MKQYFYGGTNRLLVNATASGQMIDCTFKVQVADFIHPWSNGWHETSRGDWLEVDDDKEPYPEE